MSILCICICIYLLFVACLMNLSITRDFIASNDMIWTNVGRIDHSSSQCIISWFVWSDWGKYTKVCQGVRSPDEEVGFQEYKAEVVTSRLQRPVSWYRVRKLIIITYFKLLVSCHWGPQWYLVCGPPYFAFWAPLVLFKSHSHHCKSKYSLFKRRELLQILFTCLR
jgi:hypothetical protein